MLKDLKYKVKLGLYNDFIYKEYMPKKVILCDVTLREGEQTPGVYFSLKKKKMLAELLDVAGIEQIQLGLINSLDIQKNAKMLKKSKLKAQLEIMTSANDDNWKEQINKAIELGTDIVHTNIASSPYIAHMYPLLTEKELSCRIENVVKYIKEKRKSGINLSLLDAPRTPWPILRNLIVIAGKNGVDRIRIADSIGVSTPLGMYNLISKVKKLIEKIGLNNKIMIGVHCHNDFGLATANTIASVEAGAELVDIAVNNLGERAGNADLAEVTAILELIYQIDTGINLSMLKEISKQTEKYSRKKLPSNKAIVGDHVFCDQAEIHVKAFLEDPFSFQGYDPELVGSKKNILIGPYSGICSLQYKLKMLGISINDNRLELFLGNLKSKCGRKNVSDKKIKELISKFQKNGGRK